MKKNYLLIICLLTTITGMAQDRRSLKESYEEFRRQAQESYKDFRDRANAEYAEFMRRSCDWGYYQLIKTVADKYCGAASNESVVFQMFILTQSGYKVRISNYENKNEI
ncbi:MAG: hypothetical protein LBR10_08900 [Prevotellaceae bacterium]|nr:hypothetical protein [Prevotellaceae bacterium]